MFKKIAVTPTADTSAVRLNNILYNAVCLFQNYGWPYQYYRRLDRSWCRIGTKWFKVDMGVSEISIWENNRTYRQSNVVFQRLVYKGKSLGAVWYHKSWGWFACVEYFLVILAFLRKMKTEMIARNLTIKYDQFVSKAEFIFVFSFSFFLTFENWCTFNLTYSRSVLMLLWLLQFAPCNRIHRFQYLWFFLLYIRFSELLFNRT